MVRLSIGLSVTILALTSPLAARGGDVDAVRASTGKVQAVKDLLKGMPAVYAGHKVAAVKALDAAEAELWDAIKAGGKTSAVRYELTVKGPKKLSKCADVLKQVSEELRDARGGMQGHCASARRHVEVAIAELEKAQSEGKGR